MAGDPNDPSTQPDPYDAWLQHPVIAVPPANFIQINDPATTPTANAAAPAPTASGPPPADADKIIRQWLDQHQFAPPEKQPDQGEQHVLLNGEDMSLSAAVKLAADATKQPLDAVKRVISAALMFSKPPTDLPIVGPGNQIPGINIKPGGGAIDPALMKMVEMQDVDKWLDEHDFRPPEIRDPDGVKVLLDGKETTMDEVANRIMAVRSGATFLRRDEVVAHLRQKYVAARGAPSSTQLQVSYQLTPKPLQVSSGTKVNQHQFAVAITWQHHAGDSAGREESAQGSVTFDDKGQILNLQGQWQEAFVKPLLNGWVQVSGFAQAMASANWDRSASGKATVSAAFQVGAGGQIVITPAFRSGPLKFLNGHVQIGVQGTVGGQVDDKGNFSPAASGGVVVTIPIPLP